MCIAWPPQGNRLLSHQWLARSKLRMNFDILGCVHITTPCQSSFLKRLLDEFVAPLDPGCGLHLAAAFNPCSCLIWVLLRVKLYHSRLCHRYLAACHFELPALLADCAVRHPAHRAAFIASTQYDCCSNNAL